MVQTTAKSRDEENGFGEMPDHAGRLGLALLRSIVAALGQPLCPGRKTPISSARIFPVRQSLDPLYEGLRRVVRMERTSVMGSVRCPLHACDWMLIVGRGRRRRSVGFAVLHHCIRGAGIISGPNGVIIIEKRGNADVW